MKSFKYISISLVMIFFPFCGEEESNDIVPGYPNFTINLNITDTELRAPNTFKEYVKGSYPVLAGKSLGYAGLVIVNSIHATNVPDLFAFDLSCPYERRPSIRVKTTDRGGILIAKCEECGREFDLMKKGTQVDNKKVKLQPYAVEKTSEANVFRIIRKF